MAHKKKRSRADRKAPMSDMQAPKGLTLSKSSQGSESRPISDPPGHELELPSIGASFAVAEAAQGHDEFHEPDEEVETDQTKRVKKARVTKEIKSKILNGSSPTLTPSISSGSSNVKMTEVRARAARHKGQMNFEAESTSRAR